MKKTIHNIMIDLDNLEKQIWDSKELSVREKNMLLDLTRSMGYTISVVNSIEENSNEK